MPPHPALARAKLLMERGRWAMAAGELRRALHDQPEDSLLHAYLALCLVEDPDRLDEAQESALWATAKDPLQAAVVTAVLLTWTAGSLFDLLLFGDPLGRHALTRTQRAGAVAMAALVTGEGLFGFTAALLALYTIPIAATLRARPGWPRALAAVYTLLLAVPAAVYVTTEARGVGDPGLWFGLTCGRIGFSDVLSDLLSRRI